MGGRGASSGMSDKGNPYGSHYHTVLEKGRIKFVAKNERANETLMETMTPGRIYVETGGNDLLRIMTFDKNNKRNHVIERDKRSKKGESWHVHNGYFHSEKGTKRHEPLSSRDKLLLAIAKKLWYNRGKT